MAMRMACGVGLCVWLVIFKEWVLLCERLDLLSVVLDYAEAAKFLGWIKASFMSMTMDK